MTRHGASLSDEVIAFCEGVFADGGALFCGAGGDRFVYELRARFDLFCKFTPLCPHPVLSDSGALRPERLEGVDIVAVRENTGGMYLGEWSMEQAPAGGRTARHAFSYCEPQIARIVDVAARLAQTRRGRVTVTTKPGGVPAISTLWEEIASERCDAAGVHMQVLEIDNAVYQLIADPRQFDVVVSPNMFGDVMADGGAVLLGSRGMSFSGNFSPEGRGVFQTGHGAAHDLAGSDRANPVGQMLSLAMMLREAFGLDTEATCVEHAIADTLARGIRTPDIAGPGSTVVGTRDFGRAVGAALSARLEGREAAAHRAA
ncbi:3-isopropylmalate dehydrogenase [Thioalkalivibrio paradoxus ARh 1]|uniref:3-isopropylmalate dehydrogenase n=1 Tax=Thioalkalivibrio paradoxus ARh 1 TaxID=713585 RepID=W0DMH0_9GAMM|nr:3-isopropylmalate dehydrogenase [Thioalkalivibrio paradoxus ARh 1]